MMTYEQALRTVGQDTENLSGESADYEWGQLELLADLYPLPGVERPERADQIRRDVRAVVAGQAVAAPPLRVSLDGGPVELEIDGLTVAVESFDNGASRACTTWRRRPA